MLENTARKGTATVPGLRLSVPAPAPRRTAQRSGSAAARGRGRASPAPAAGGGPVPVARPRPWGRTSLSGRRRPRSPLRAAAWLTAPALPRESWRGGAGRSPADGISFARRGRPRQRAARGDAEAGGDRLGPSARPGNAGRDRGAPAAARGCTHGDGGDRDPPHRSQRQPAHACAAAAFERRHRPFRLPGLAPLPPPAPIGCAPRTAPRPLEGSAPARRRRPLGRGAAGGGGGAATSRVEDEARGGGGGCASRRVAGPPPPQHSCRWWRPTPPRRSGAFAGLWPRHSRRQE